MQFGFGSGNLIGITTGVPPQAAKFGALQDVSLDFAFTNKELYGPYQFPLDVGRGKSKIACKAKLAQIRADIYSGLFFGVNKTTGMTLASMDEAGTIPASTPWQITVANSATWAVDCGVLKNGVPMVRVTSAPATGQYSVAAGVYTFAAADANAQVLISYTYTAVGGWSMTITNQLLGLSPNFQVIMTQLYEGQTMTVILNKCIASKLTIPTKLDDYVIQEFDFAAMADVNNIVGTVALTQ